MSSDGLMSAPASGAEASSGPGSAGLGIPPRKPLQSFPPITPHVGSVVVSPKTGEPVRCQSIVVTQVAFWLSAAFATIGYGSYWFQAMHRGQFHTASWVTGWLHPRPGGFWSIMLVCGLAAVLAAMFAAPCITAYQAWTGHRFSRLLAVGSIIISLLGMLFNWWAIAAIPCALTGAILLYLPQSANYFTQWDTVRTLPPAPEASRQVQYGRLERFA